MDYGLRVITGIIIGLNSTLRCLKQCFCFCQRGQRVPPITEELLTFSATTLAEKIRKKEVTSYELVSTYIDRIKLVNPIINAVAEDRFVEALREAQDVDALLEQEYIDIETLKRTKPLLGIPVTIKEALQVKGLNSTKGCKLYDEEKADEDGAAVHRLRGAGAIILLVSTTPEFCIAIETYGTMYGLTRNPYNTLYSVGGSSGGEAALLAAGASLIGLGSDLAGSIRNPCALNGIFGLKPTNGTIPTSGHQPAPLNEYTERFLTVGPMTRYAEDLLLMTKVLTDWHRLDKLRLDESVDLSKLNVFFMTDCGSTFGLKKVQEEIKRAVLICVDQLQEKCNATISQKKFSTMAYATEICATMATQMDLQTPFHSEDRQYGVYSQLFLCMFGRSQFSAYTMIHEIIVKIGRSTLNAQKLEKYTNMLDDLREEMRTELKDTGVFIYPAFSVNAQRKHEFLLAYTGILYTFIFNVLGFPTVTVPIGFARNGLPLTVQVIANANEDRLCFAVAKELESLFGGWRSP